MILSKKKALRSLTLTLQEVLYDVIMPYAIHINNVNNMGLKRPQM